MCFKEVHTQARLCMMEALVLPCAIYMKGAKPSQYGDCWFGKLRPPLSDIRAVAEPACCILRPYLCVEYKCNRGMHLTQFETPANSGTTYLHSCCQLMQSAKSFTYTPTMTCI